MTFFAMRTLRYSCVHFLLSRIYDKVPSVRPRRNGAFLQTENQLECLKQGRHVWVRGGDARVPYNDAMPRRTGWSKSTYVCICGDTFLQITYLVSHIQSQLYNGATHSKHAHPPEARVCISTHCFGIPQLVYMLGRGGNGR